MPFAFINTKPFKSEECRMSTLTSWLCTPSCTITHSSYLASLFVCFFLSFFGICMYMGFPGSANKESTYSAGDPGSISWLGSSPGEGID